MPDRATAVLQDEEGRAVLRFQRRLAHPPSRVWRALTATEELAGWHPTPFEFEPAVGGRVTYRTDLGGPSMPPGRVLEYDPPRAFAYTWGGDEVRFELQQQPEGCLLTLTHAFADRLKAARDAAGWDLCLLALASRLDGAPVPSRGKAQRIPEGWSELNREYDERFGIAPEQATPPPSAAEV